MKINKVKSILEKNGIIFDSIEEIIDGCDCTVATINIDGITYYFKFLDKSLYEKLLLEVDVVKYLKERSISVPSYYEKDKREVFKDEEYTFYASEKVRGKKLSTNITKSILEDIIKNISKMHKELVNYPIDDISILEKESDYDRLKDFYENKRDFLDESGLIEFVESILKLSSDNNYSLIHADLNFRNIFIDNNKFSSFIDFTDLRVGNLEDDLGKFWQNILYLENISEEDITKLENIYENNLGRKINHNNLIISTVYRIIYRYYSMIENKEDTPDEYLEKTKKILKKITY